MFIVYTLITKKKKFKSFLKAYAESFNYNEITSIEDSKRMYQYLENTKNFNFINDIIESSINSKSIYGSMILGYFAGKFLSETLKITFKELIIVEGIKELNDYELSHFIKIYSIADLSKTVSISNYKEEIQNPYLFELTISKLIQLRLVEEAPILSSGKPKGSFISSEIAEEIYFMIKDTYIETELLNYEV